MSQAFTLIQGPLHFMAGHVYGRKQPTLVVRLKASVNVLSALPSEMAADRSLEVWRSAMPGQSVSAPSKEAMEIWSASMAYLGTLAVSLLRCANFALVDQPQVIRLPADGRTDSAWSSVLLPVLPGRVSATATAWSLTLQAVTAMSSNDGLAAVQKILDDGIHSLKQMAPQGGNTPRFLRAAYASDVPVLALGMEVFQFGHGKNAQWFDSTFTLNTPNIGVRLARDKEATAARLRQAGLPVPAHRRALDADHAVRLAQSFGFPVVVKPLDQDGGRGVTAGLETEEEVRMAYEQARAVSPHVLVEQHITGRDYRLTVMDGALLWAIERIPASVTGDGVHTVRELFDLENTNPLRGEGVHAILKRLQWDDETQLLLQKQGMSPESVPVAGQTIRFRRIANVATGGQPVAVLNLVHPDNAMLAIRAAQALRLDLAGVDLLIPDISVSWKQSGAAICEVNSQPQLGATTGPHLYGEILKKRLGGQGRIPILLVLGESATASVSKVMAETLKHLGYATGLIHKNGVFFNGYPVQLTDQTALAAGQALLTSPEVEALVIAVNDDEVIEHGLPVDGFNGLVVAGNRFDFRFLRAGASQREMANHLIDVMNCIAPGCTGSIVNLSDSGLMFNPDGLSATPLSRMQTASLPEVISTLQAQWARP